MRAYSSMPTADFIAQLRDIAIRANARPLVIDQIPGQFIWLKGTP